MAGVCHNGIHMDTLQGIEDLKRWRGTTFVPTMGALHEGHCALIRRAASFGAPVVVSIFVNARQFAPGEDFDAYPRSLDADLAAAKQSGAAAVFLPSTDLVFPDGVDLRCPSLPGVAISPGLEDTARPHFFSGVCLVVARLFDLLLPARAVFGEKDWQQLKVIEAMVRDHADRFPLDIVSCPTSRDTDGLALSSRNAYLDEQQRDRSTALWRALQLAQSADGIVAAEHAMGTCLNAAGLDVEYAVVRDAQTLEPLDATAEAHVHVRHPESLPAMRALIAARLDNVRLIDNAPFPATYTST